MSISTVSRWWRWLVVVALTALAALSARDLFSVAWGTGVWLGEFSPLWSAAFLLGCLGLLGLLVLSLIVLWRPAVLDGARRRWIDLRGRLDRARWILVVALPAVVAWAYHFADPAERWTWMLGTVWLRALIFVLAMVVMALLIGADSRRLLAPSSLALAAVLFCFVVYSAGLFTEVTNYPFSLGWSEGNRLYDYSLVFGQDLYNYDGVIVNPYGSPVRYGLWGVLFLWRGLPIAAHRFWDALLYTWPVALAAWCLVRPVRPAWLRWTLVFWLALFLNQGPIYPHLLVPALTMLIWLYHPSPYVRGGTALVASVLLGLSRWTWAVGPGIWGALVDLLMFYPRRRGSLVRRLAPAVAIGLAGTLPGALPTWMAVLGGGDSGNLAANQPLLWYRLFPNPTYPPGILLATLLASAPLVIFLLWLALSRRWVLDRWQAAAVLSATVVLLLAGTLISLKIGGGSNLHNLDLYLVTLALLTGVAFQQAGLLRKSSRPTLPVWVRILLVVGLFIPGYMAVRQNNRLVLPSALDAEFALQLINDQVTASSGPVLFSDQRQLLTFGYVPAIPFIPEYEKKYMMDQAMAGNAAYFAAYYRDLASRRFALIVTERLTLAREDPVLDDFAEETNAWITWVSEPTLCFYYPISTMKKFNIQLLVPRAETSGCARYLELPVR